MGPVFEENHRDQAQIDVSIDTSSEANCDQVLLLSRLNLQDKLTSDTGRLILQS